MTQVNQNFSDIIAGTSDSTKDFSIAALTCAGNVTLNGTTNTIGNASSDDIVITASLASTVNIKTTFTYDIGSSTIGLRSLYLGDAGSAARSTRILGGTVASSWTLTLPTGVPAANNYVLSGATSGASAWSKVLVSPSTARNYALSPAVAASALTITMNGGDGNALSATNYATIVFRHATIATGTQAEVDITSSPSIVISSGSTLGHASGKLEYIYVYAINNAGTIELAVSSKLFDDMGVITTTVLAGSGGDDSATVMYSTTARTGVAFRLIGILQSSQATAGTWDTAIANTASRREPRYTWGSRQVITATGAQTWTRPSGCLAVNVRVVGGGAAGGGAAITGSGTASIGSGGGGGGYSEKFITRGLGATETATVGAGGTGVSGAAGNVGGTSSFGSHCQATGGGASATAAASSSARNAGGGVGGVGSGGDINLVGQDGQGSVTTASAGVALAGGGGSSALGGGGGGCVGVLASATLTGVVGGVYGGGGGGNFSGQNQGAASTGPAGGQGIIIVDEFY